ncbi:MAG TPA: ABC transporter substrate-binding protein [Ureibacillus sp.]|nr:ABC transporter substrate-binding protein [Ureibacillus sp.]
MKKWLTVMLVIVVGVLLVACGDDKVSTAKTTDGKNVIKYQLMKGMVYPAELAVDLGYLEGIELESVSDFKGGTESVQYVGTGEVDLGMAFSAAVVKAYSKNVDLKSVIGYYGSDDLTNISAFVLEDSSIKNPKDLINKKVGVNILGAHMELAIKGYLKQGGLSDKEIESVQLVTVPLSSAEQTLRSNQVDAVLLMGQSKDLAVERGGIRELFSDIDVVGKNFTAGNYFFRSDYVKENPEVIKQFVEGVAKAIEWSRETPREEVVERMEKIIKERDPNESTESVKYWKSYGVGTEGGVIQEEEMQMWIDWLVENGELEKDAVTASELYTNQYNPYAK